MKHVPVPLRPVLPSDDATRKRVRLIFTMDYFPDALLAVAEVIVAGNEQHNPGEPVYWARGKSGDEAGSLLNHFVDRGLKDTDGLRHSAKLAWRALAMLQKEIEEEKGLSPSRGSRVPVESDPDQLEFEYDVDLSEFSPTPKTAYEKWFMTIERRLAELEEGGMKK